MADKKPTDTPEKTGQTVLGGDKAADKQQAPPAPDKVPAPPAGGKEDKAPPAGPADKAPGKQAPPAPDKAPAPPADGKEDNPAPAGPGDKAPGKQAPPAPDKAPVPPAGGKEDKPAPVGPADKAPGKQAPPAPGKAAPDTKAPGGPEVTDEGDSLDMWNKEQAAIDAKKPGRKPRASKTAEKSGSTDQADKPPARRGRPKKTEQTAPPKTPAKREKDYKPDFPPTVPKHMRVDAPRPKEPEQIVHINLTELHPFKDHPFGVRDDAEMQALAESVKDKGVDSPALVRPREGGGYEIVAGHRRQRASELAGYKDMPCIVRQMTDDEAVLAMTDSNLRQREKILPSEKAISLKMQVEAIKHQGARDTSGQNVQSKDAGKLSIDAVGERNGITGKQVQRYIRLTHLVPDLQKAADEGRLAFTPAVEISFIKPKHQNLIAVSIEGQQSSPSVSQAKRMREMDQKGELNGDAIDGILSQEKKEEIRVIISGAELEKYFGKGKTPQEMKEQIVKLLDDWAGKEKEQAPPVKKADRDK